VNIVTHQDDSEYIFSIAGNTVRNEVFESHEAWVAIFPDFQRRPGKGALVSVTSYLKRQREITKGSIGRVRSSADHRRTFNDISSLAK
jgi:hypothetical protein